ncbi:hypothetical protein [Paenibacillus sp. Mc5Re-14]|uniref:hypothetical protein n=1 Tax=Paenibacillus sp. Mc5Re-14 TaxID=1030529 RepID=UPI000A4E1DCD|nr:hypothetical protein [Paenibacillus sp. Mc5Re-14]
MVNIKSKSAFFKAVNMVSSKMEGDRAARMALAHAIVSNCRLTEINELFERESMTTLVKLVVTAGITPETVEEAKQTKKPKQTSNEPKKVQAKRKQKVIAPAEKIVYTGLPDSMNEFTKEQRETVEGIILRYIENANKQEGAHMDAQRFNYIDGMNALTNVTSIEDLQAVMVAYFMRDYARKVINKYLEMGVGYKKLNTSKALENIEQKQSYMQASSNRGNIQAFDADDILNDLIVDAYRLTFNESMFDNTGNALTTIFYRISNVIQVRTRELRNQTKVVTAKKQYIQEEGASYSTEEEALQMAVEMGIFTDAEMEIIQLRVAGFKKNEIDKMFGKRTDRTFNKMEQKFYKAV